MKLTLDKVGVSVASAEQGFKGKVERSYTTGGVTSYRGENINNLIKNDLKRARNIRATNLHATTRKNAMSISEYFSNSITQTKKEIDQNPEEYILNIDAEELAEYYTQKYSLPLVEKDESREITIEKVKSRYGRGRIPLRVYYPIIPKNNLQTVIKRDSSTRFMSGFSVQLQGDWLMSNAEILDERSMKTHIENVEKVIGWKNDDVREGKREDSKLY